MAKQSEFVRYLLDMLQGFGAVRARAMFGGYGIYRDEVMFAIVADDELYVKVDDHSRECFESEGLYRFCYSKNGKTVYMSYYTVPDGAIDNRETLHEWAERGYQAALRARKKLKKR